MAKKQTSSARAVQSERGKKTATSRPDAGPARRGREPALVRTPGDEAARAVAEAVGAVAAAVEAAAAAVTATAGAAAERHRKEVTELLSTLVELLSRKMEPRGAEAPQAGLEGRLRGKVRGGLGALRGPGLFAAEAAEEHGAEAEEDPLRKSGREQPELWQRFVRLCLFSLQNDEAMLVPAFGLSDPQRLREYVIAQEGDFGLIQLHDAAYKALENAASTLAETHAKAAKIKVDTITSDSPNAVSIMEDLRTLSEAIKGDQNLSAALSLTVALLDTAVKAYGG